MHKKTNARPSWDFRRKYGRNNRVPLEHYRYWLIVAEDTKAVKLSGTVEFCQLCLIRPILTHADIIIHSINTPSFSLTDVQQLLVTHNYEQSQNSMIYSSGGMNPPNWAQCRRIPPTRKPTVTLQTLENTENATNHSNPRYHHLQGCTARRWLHNIQGCA